MIIVIHRLLQEQAIYLNTQLLKDHQRIKNVIHTMKTPRMNLVTLNQVILIQTTTPNLFILALTSVIILLNL